MSCWTVQDLDVFLVLPNLPLTVEELTFKCMDFFLLELESSKKQTEQDKKAIDDLVRERDILNKVNL